MAKGAYIGVDNISRKIKGGFIGVDNKARKIKKAYIGIGGKARPCWGGSSIPTYYGTTTSLSEVKSGHYSATVGDYALFAGGVSENSYGTYRSAVVNAFNKSLTRTTATNLVAAREGVATASIGDYAIFAHGINITYSGASISGSTFIPYIDVYNKSLTKTTQTLTLNIARQVGATVGDYALFAGGVGKSNINVTGFWQTSSVISLNKSLTYSTATPFTNSRGGHCGVSIGDYALFAGGVYQALTYDVYYSTEAYAYDKSLTMTSTASLSVGRESLAAASTGKNAFFAGGSYEKQGTYAPQTYYTSVVDSFNTSLVRTTCTPLSQSKYQLSGAALGDSVIFAGGYNEIATAEIYDSSLTRHDTNNLSIGRSAMATATIGNYALFTGGSYYYQGSYSSYYTYQNTVDCWTIV